MDKYNVSLRAPKGHAFPPLLSAFGKWLRRQDYGSVGWFGLKGESIPDDWDSDANAPLRDAGFSFLHLPDGSLLALLRPDNRPHAGVILLGSEGARETVATSLEEFLLALAEGETGVHELDEEEATGRTKLARWLTAREVSAPEAQDFDLQAYLDGDATSTASPPEQRPKATSEVISSFTPFLRELASIVGRRSDDPELVAFVTEKLGKKVPASMSDMSDTKNVTASKLGIEMLFSHDVLHRDYPLINKSKRSFVPYLSLVWLQKKLPEPLPFGLEFSSTDEQIEALLGAPNATRGAKKKPVWDRALDQDKDIILTVSAGQAPTIRVNEARELSSRHGTPSAPATGLFIAWAALRGLLDEAQLSDHRDLIADIRGKRRQGTQLLEAALPRGLWDIHLEDRPGLRDFAFGWFHNIPRGTFIRDDLVKVFGGREGPHGHEEPVLDDDSWAAVETALPVLDARFQAWL